MKRNRNPFFIAFVIGILLLSIPAQSLASGNSIDISDGYVSQNMDGNISPLKLDGSGNFSVPNGDKTVGKKRPMLSKPTRNETIEVRQFKTKYGGKFSLVKSGLVKTMFGGSRDV